MTVIKNDSLLSEESDAVKMKYRLAMLYDFYGELIKEHNRQIFEDYVFNDLSLAEIAASQSISRQGVHDIIKRTSKQLFDYEDRLKLIDKYDNIMKQVELAKNTIIDIKKNGNISGIDNVEKMLDCILEQI